MRSRNMLETSLTESRSHIEKSQLLALGLLMVLGTLFVYSATMIGDAAMAPFYKQTWFRQIVWYAIGLGAAAGLCCVDYRTLARWSFIFYCFAIFLLVAVLVPGIGKTHSWGARRWIDIGPFQTQPSEFAKLAFILAGAHFLSRPVEEVRSPMIFWKSIGLMVLPFLLILKEPDLGSAIVLVPTCFALMFVAGTPRRYLVRLFAGVGLVGALFLVDVLFAPPGWWQIKLEDYQRQRLLVYFNVDFARGKPSAAERAHAIEVQKTKSYQVRQALISVGSGGMTGTGWHKGNQTSLGFLPPGML